MGMKEKRRRKRRAAARKRILCVAILLVGVIGCIWSGIRLKSTGDRRSDREINADIATEVLEVAVTETSEKVDTTADKESSADTGTDAETITDTAIDTESVEASALQSEYQRISELSAGELAATGLVSEELTEQLFYSIEIDDTIFSRMNGFSYTENEYVSKEDLRYLKMLCFGSDGNTYVGEMVVNEKIADTVLEIFQTLYENQYPIERMVLVDNYQAEDEVSMSSNNTSAFNYRPIAGSSKLSKHSYGLAIDINPRYNPCVKTAADGSVICQPENGRDYIDRSKDFLYKIDENDLAYQLFTKAGFTWGGSWNSLKDYQHFEYAE